MDNSRTTPQALKMSDDLYGQLVTCRVDELHPHPSYVRHHLAVPACKLSAVAERGALAFQEPLVITQDRTIIDGHARYELARQQGRTTLPCIEYEVNESEALNWILQSHRRSNGLNDFTRILLALDLEPWLREKAQANQRAGGQKKGSSTLTEAERLDVRSAIAAAAGVSVGNVTKVRQLTTAACPELIQALCCGGIRIHRAWQWSKEPREEQREKLSRYQSAKGINRTIRSLISRHRSSTSPTLADIGDLLRLLSAVESGKLEPISVVVTGAPGRTVFLSEELFRSLGKREEFALECVTNSR